MLTRRVLSRATGVSLLPGTAVAARVVASLLLLSCGACATSEEISGRAAHADPEGQIGAIHLVEDLRATTGIKTLVAAYGFTATGVTSSVARVVYGAGTSPASEGSDFRVVLVSDAGETMAQYMIRNPRRLLVERKGVIEEEEVYYVVRFPFSVRAAQVRVLDRRGKMLASTDVGSVIREFCVTAHHDEDCATLGP